MMIGVPRETFDGEQRVALVPSSVPSLLKSGFSVLVETGAGQSAGFPDEQYSEQGARMTASRRELFAESSLILQVRAAGANLSAAEDDLPLFRDGQIVIAACDPLSEPEALRSLAEKNVVCFALELLPRITRAQSMDILSSMATIAGYKAVIMAADLLPRMFPLLMTAAGTITPARVLVIGAGVAGLQAIATARRLGAVVQAYDVRPAVKEQVESLGARFVELELDAGESEGKGGYAEEMDEEFYRRQRKKMTEVVAETDVVITTAAIPGKPAPVLVTAEMVAGMPNGALIVDLAAERGGNCELTQAGETVIEHGVTILGPTNLPSTIPYHASEMLSRNITTFVASIVKESSIHIDLEDEVLRETCVTADGDVVHPRIRQLLGMDPLEAETGEAEKTAAAEAESEKDAAEESAADGHSGQKEDQSGTDQSGTEAEANTTEPTRENKE
ncbi:MAG: Re/Si-specific NAD(P)(+) transhydrogenase subunit alpha [Planctomycetes bacterium]|nr:Re/Si-specific NAD(P)(+) transhydrogenase subunit alpha [Planctomycetota bacterium]